MCPRPPAEPSALLPACCRAAASRRKSAMTAVAARVAAISTDLPFGLLAAIAADSSGRPRRSFAASSASMAFPMAVRSLAVNCFRNSFSAYSPASSESILRIAQGIRSQSRTSRQALEAPPAENEGLAPFLSALDTNSYPGSAFGPVAPLRGFCFGFAFTRPRDGV